jgi:hypothetical protein
MGEMIERTPETTLWDLQESYRLAQQGDFTAALQALPAPPLGKGNSNWAAYRLTLKLVTHAPVDANDLLALFPGRLTKVGKDNVRKVAERLNDLLEHWRSESGQPLLERVAELAADYEWRDWDFAYLNGTYGTPGRVVVRTLSFAANESLRELACTLIREAENEARVIMGMTRVRERKGRRPRRAQKPPVAMRGYVAQEDLPLPYVHYTGPYGTFLAFSESRDSIPMLCSCAEPAVANLIEIMAKYPSRYQQPSAPDAVFRDLYFPEALIRYVKDRGQREDRGLLFASRLCHRCNLVSPKLRYCGEMYGGVFVQHHGWYVNQAFLRWGVLPRGNGDLLFPYIASICPSTVAGSIKQARAAQKTYLDEYQRLLTIVHGSARDDINPDEVTYWHSVRTDEAEPMQQMRREAAQSIRAVSKVFENMAREEFGFREVGERWVSETLLFRIVNRMFESEEILHHHRPQWLEGLELDIYVPSLNLGFEYQGQQHFHPVDAWGGREALKLTKLRDQKKRDMCRTAGVKLVEIDYTEPLTEDHVRKRAFEHSTT